MSDCGRCRDGRISIEEHDGSRTEEFCPVCRPEDRDPTEANAHNLARVADSDYARGWRDCREAAARLLDRQAENVCDDECLPLMATAIRALAPPEPEATSPAIDPSGATAIFFDGIQIERSRTRIAVGGKDVDFVSDSIGSCYVRQGEVVVADVPETSSPDVTVMRSGGGSVTLRVHAPEPEACGTCGGTRRLRADLNDGGIPCPACAKDGGR